MKEIFEELACTSGDKFFVKCLIEIFENVCVDLTTASDCLLWNDVTIKGDCKKINQLFSLYLFCSVLASP